MSLVEVLLKNRKLLRKCVEARKPSTENVTVTLSGKKFKRILLFEGLELSYKWVPKTITPPSYIAPPLSGYDGTVEITLEGRLLKESVVKR